MSALAILLVLCSVLVHASWNLRGKQRYASVPAFYAAILLVTLCMLPLLIPYRAMLASIPREVWIALVMTGLAQMFYFVGLAHAYRLGDISMAYPIARSLPVLMVPIVTTAIGQGGPIAPVAWGGMVLIVAGVLLLPLKRLADFHPRDYLSQGLPAILLAAVGTTGYSVIDDHALRLLRATPGWSSVSAPLVYAVLEGVFTTLWLSIPALVTRAGRGEVKRVIRTGAGHATVTGMMIFVAYGLVLAAMAFAENVGYIVAFRQLSIPLTAIAGIVLLHEKSYRLRIVGMVLTTIGLALVAVAR